MKKHVRNVKEGLRWCARMFLHSSGPEIALVSTLVLGQYLKNSDFSYPSEIWLPIILFALGASAVYYFFRLVLRQVYSAHFAALALLYALYNFKYVLESSDRLLKLLLPARFETYFGKNFLMLVLLLIAGSLLGISLVALSRLPKIHSLQLSKVLIFIVLFLFASQVVQVGWQWIKIHNELSYQSHLTVPARNQAVTSKPDIYYFVFDRYGSDATLKNIYNFDNSDLSKFLGDQGFYTNQTANANYPFTMSSISSTMAMNYHTELGKLFGKDGFQTAFPYRSILNNPPVAQILKQNGYTYNQVSSWWDFTRVGIKADADPAKSFRLRLFGHDIYLTDLQRDIVNKSVLFPILKRGLKVGGKTVYDYDLDRNPRQNFDIQMNALKTLASQPHSQPQFTFAHVLVPHDPYIFTATGADPTYDGSRTDNGVDETVKYVNQVSYLNTRIKDLVSSIRASSPSAAIVIQADEGPYPKEFRFELSPDHYYNPKDLPLPQMKQKFGVLASYYMPGVDQAEVGQNIHSSVDPFRFILSHYLGYDLPKLPECHFASGDKYNLYAYTLMNQQLTGQSAPAECAGV